jgi:phosphoglycolate phosphatase
MNEHQKFVVWDWNGTLLDDTDAVLVCVNKVMAELKQQPITMEKFRDTQIRPLEHFYRAVGLNEEDITRALENERSIFHDNYEPMADTVPLRKGALEILHLLKTSHVANIILSNHISSQIVRLLKNHEIEDYFETVMAYISREKQHRDQTKGEKLRDYMTAKGMNGANALIVGDTLEEIEIARGLGMTSIAITGGVHSERRLRALNPDHVVHSLHEITPILQERGFVS